MLGTDYPFPLGDLTAGRQLQESSTVSATIKVSDVILLAGYVVSPSHHQSDISCKQNVCFDHNLVRL